MTLINKVLKLFGLYLCKSWGHQSVYQIHFCGGDELGTRFTDSIILALPMDIYHMPIKDIQKLIEIQTGFKNVFQVYRSDSI